MLDGYALVFGVTVWLFVHWYEEPTLMRQFGSAYDEYLTTVPRLVARRPRRRANVPLRALRALTANGLFIGQSAEFFAVITGLGQAADAARHGT